MSEYARERLRRLLGGKPAPLDMPPAAPRPLKSSSVKPSASPTPSLLSRLEAPAPAVTKRAAPQPVRSSTRTASPEPLADARLYLQELRGKMARLAEEFAQGKLNRTQFQEIYAHYQRQRMAVERAIYEMPGPDAWRESLAAGHTSILRQRYAAQVLSYAIYDNTTSLPLASVGKFTVDTGLLVPMLSSFRSATQEIFGAGMRSTEIEGGRWLCFVPGRYTTLLVVFSVEPARLQLTQIEDLLRDFETAYGAMLSSGAGAEAAQQFVKLWALDQTVV